MSEMKNDGGAAFPVSELCDWPGLSLRDYFAAHAPAEPQAWFAPVMPIARPAAVWPNGAPGPYDDYAANSDEIRQWDRAAECQRLIQWPWAWADAMLKARDAAPEPRDQE